MLTTLRTGSLTLSSVQYKFDANKKLRIKLTASSAHKLYGDVNITLANVKNINIYDKNGLLVEDYFNRTFKFIRTDSTTLEYSETINSGVAQTESLATLANNGSSITATIANSSVDLERGIYNFLLLDTVDSDFSTSKISIKLLNLDNTDIDGIESVFNELGDTNYLSINNQDLTFDLSARVSIKDNNAGTTNIPLLITKIK
jgi:hypothetical protein